MQNFRSFDVESLDFDKGNGLVTVVTQDAVTGAVLMVAFADREAVARTIATGEMHYMSRTRGLWHKGATSGAIQKVQSLSADCDGDTVLARVIPQGPACHTGAETCFGSGTGDILSSLAAVIDTRANEEPDTTSYTQRLLGNANLRHKKLGEEAVELALACASGDRSTIAEEAADLIYHALVAARAQGVSLRDIRDVLARRHG